MPRGTSPSIRPSHGIPVATEAALSTPFLVRFATHLITRLRADGAIDLAPGDATRAIHHLADQLAGQANVGAISAVSRALLDNPFIAEVYLSDADLKATITDLDPQAAR